MLKPGWTTAEIAEACRKIFPECDPGQLRAIYLPARYSELTPVTKADAEAAADAWHTLKHSKNPIEKL